MSARRPGSRDVAGRHGRLGRHRRARLHVLLDLALHGAHEGLHLEVVGRLVVEDLDARRDVGLGRFEAEQPDALLALDDGSHGAVLGLHDLGDLGQRAHAVELVDRLDVLALGLALRDEGDERIAGHGAVERLHGLLAADLERHDHLREDDGLAQRHERAGRAARPAHGRVLAPRGGGDWLLGSAGHQVSLARVVSGVRCADRRRAARPPAHRPPRRPVSTAPGSL